LSDALTKFLATWGALVATGGLGWTIYRDFADRGKLKVQARIMRIGVSTTGQQFLVSPTANVQAAPELYFAVTVVNVGRRPVKWVGWGGKYLKPPNNRHSFVGVSRYLPKMLEEGQDHDEVEPLTQETVETIENARKLFVWDSSGKKWVLSRKQLKELKQKSRELAN
jgi:hypothetical protein